MIPNDPYPPFTELTLTQLGAAFGVSGQKAGRWLTEIGLRTLTGQPVRKAVEAGVAVLHEPEHGGKAFWEWDKDKTIRLLELAGHRRACASESEMQPPLPLEPKLHGPFTIRPCKVLRGHFEVADADGVVAISCWGKEVAEKLVWMLNLAHKTKKWFC